MVKGWMKSTDDKMLVSMNLFHFFLSSISCCKNRRPEACDFCVIEGCKESLRDIIRKKCYDFFEVINMRDIAKNIKNQRERRNLTQEDLAERLFVTRQTISNYETGRSRPDVEMLIKIADALETDPNSLLYGLPGQEQRRSRVIKTAIAAIILVIMELAYEMLRNKVLYLQGETYNLSYGLALNALVHPMLLIVTGWMLAELLKANIRPWPLKQIKYMKLLTGGLIGGYLLIMLPIVIMHLLGVQIPQLWNWIALLLIGAYPKQAKVFIFGIQVLLGALLRVSFLRKAEDD